LWRQAKLRDGVAGSLPGPVGGRATVVPDQVRNPATIPRPGPKSAENGVAKWKTMENAGFGKFHKNAESPEMFHVEHFT
jgi:hypothetical protein